MANEAAKTQTINIVPVQGIFEPEPTFALLELKHKPPNTG
jgi:hypothetical protein